MGAFAISAICVNPTYAQAPVPLPIPLKDKPLTEIVEYFASQDNVPVNQLLDTMQCESSGQQSARGDGGHAYGIFQFHQPTWDAFSNKMGEQLDINSTYDQAKLAAWAFSQGYQHHWTCFSKLYGT